jgi:hypothetical protein
MAVAWLSFSTATGMLVSFLQQLTQRQVAPIQIDSVDNHAFARIDQARGADADAHDGFQFRPEQSIDDLVDEFERILTVTVLHGQLDGLSNLTLQIYDGSDEFFLCEVQADEIS